jgi:Retrotransposon gag protein/Zinc knuckle
MGTPIDWSQFPHLTDDDRETAGVLVSAMGEAALLDILRAPAESHAPRLRRFREFADFHHGRGKEDAHSELNAAMELAHVRAEEAARQAALLERALGAVQSAQAATPRPPPLPPKRAVKMDAPKFNGEEGSKLAHWLIAVEHCGTAQLIETDDQMVKYAISNLRGRASDWAFSAIMADQNAFPTWKAFKELIREMYESPNNEILLQTRFFNTRQGKNSLQTYVQEMRGLCAAITQNPLPEAVKVPAFMNGLRPSAARRELYRRVPPTMEEAIRIAFIEEQSYDKGTSDGPYHKYGGNKGSSHKPTGSQRHGGPTPMELGSAEVTCYNCGKKGHFSSRCNKPRAQKGTAMRRTSNNKQRKGKPQGGKPTNTPAKGNEGSQ